MSEHLRAPFPWFGGKTKVADVVWRGLGPEVPNYVEPFAGSLAVLLKRPGGAGKIETINDRDSFVSNFWRAVTLAPEETARWCDWPVSETDLSARHIWLMKRLPELRSRLFTEPDYFDAQVAGWWVWGINQWIGSGWCSESSARHKKPHIGGLSKGVNRLPSIGNDRGVHGTKQQKPQIGGPSRGLEGRTAPPALEWFEALQARLRHVRLISGDWKRVVTPAALGQGKFVGGRRPCAVFLDPPYDLDLRDADLYGVDQRGISAAVRKWAIENGDDPDLRIALCGFIGEHEMPKTWQEYSWQANRGYGKNENRTKEMIWFSPHCHDVVQRQGNLF